MATNAEALQGIDFVGVEDEPRRRALPLPPQTLIGLALTAVGLVALLITWLQIKDVQNIAAQIPYVASGGLLGVALSVMGGVALFAGVKAPAVEQATMAELTAQVEDLQVQLKWTADAVEQIADYLNELAQSGVDTSGGRR